MIIKKISSASSEHGTQMWGSRFTEQLFNLNITNNNVSYQTIGFYFSDGVEPMSLAMVYFNKSGIMTPEVVKKSPSDEYRNKFYSMSLRHNAKKIEEMFEMRNAECAKYDDIAEFLMINFNEKIFD